MTFGTLIRGILKGTTGFQQFTLVDNLFNVAVNICDKDYYDEITVRNWMREGSKNTSYTKRFKDDKGQDKAFNDTGFLNFLHAHSPSKWTDMQLFYVGKKDNDYGNFIEYDTKDRDVFFKGVLNEFKSIVGSGTPVKAKPFVSGEDDEYLTDHQISIGYLTDHQISNKETSFSGTEIWVAVKNFSIDIEHQGAFHGVMPYNLNKGVKYKYFIPSTTKHDDIERFRKYCEYSSNLEIYFLTEEYDLGPYDIGYTVYEPFGSEKCERKCYYDPIFNNRGALAGRRLIEDARAQEIVDSLNVFVKNDNKYNVLKFRQYMPTDIDGLAKIYADAYKGGHWSENWLPERAVNRLNELCNSNRSIAVVCENEDGKLVGCVICEKNTWYNQKQLEGKELFVDPQYRGQKIGLKLVEQVMNSLAPNEISEFFFWTKKSLKEYYAEMDCHESDDRIIMIRKFERSYYQETI